MPAKRRQVLQAFTRGPDEIVVQTTRDAIAGLKENKYFPNPPADPATLEAKLVEFIEAITAANQGGKHDKLFKSKKREELLVLLRQDAMYVQTHCNDDIEKLMSSGLYMVQVRALSASSRPAAFGLE